MPKTIKCPECGSDAATSGVVRCWCDKDFCSGQRCGANELAADYTCTNPNCKSTGKTPEAAAYYKHYSP